MEKTETPNVVAEATVTDFGHRQLIRRMERDLNLSLQAERARQQEAEQASRNLQAARARRQEAVKRYQAELRDLLQSCYAIEVGSEQGVEGDWAEDGKSLAIRVVEA